MEPTIRFSEFKDSWGNYKIEDIFDKIGIAVSLNDTQMYYEIGIRSHGKGIFYKEGITAAEIGNKRVFGVEPNCFIVNIVFAWERAVAKTTERERGMVASHRFPMYKPKENIVDVDACMTRLRVTVNDTSKVGTQEEWKQNGALGLIIKDKGVQAIYGPKADVIKSNVQDALGV